MFGDRVEILGHRDVRLAARIERDEQQAARRQALLAQLLEAEDDRGGVAVVKTRVASKRVTVARLDEKPRI